jgi:uncharacterized protein YcbK (DUF882 family)
MFIDKDITMPPLILPSRRSLILSLGSLLVSQPAIAGVKMADLPTDFSDNPGNPTRKTASRAKPKQSARAKEPQAPAVSDSKRSSRRGDRFIYVKNKYDRRTHRAVFFTGGRYIDDETPAVNIALRDHHSGATADMQRRLLDFIFLTHQELRTNNAFFLVSGYRSPATNHMLRQESLRRNGGKTGVAKNSPHMRARASDLKIRGRSTSQVYRAARSVSAQLRYGGVGLYTGSGFVHLDGNRRRTWGA